MAKDGGRRKVCLVRMGRLTAPGRRRVEGRLTGEPRRFLQKGLGGVIAVWLRLVEQELLARRGRCGGLVARRAAAPVVCPDVFAASWS
jgi:hypothetical protein